MDLDDDFGHDGHDGMSALQMGTAYALFRHGQDRQTEQLLAGQRGGGGQTTININLNEGDQPGHQVVNALDLSTVPMPQGWDDFVGQEPLKRQLRIHVQAALKRGARLPHCLLGSGMPGAGKTTMARLLAKMMNVSIIELVPPFNIYTLVDAGERLLDNDILFIDEIHKLADNGKRGAEILLKILEDGVAYTPDGEVHSFNDITIIGATTDKDMLPETVIDRFKIKPYFQPYSIGDLGEIAMDFAFRHRAQDVIPDRLALAMAKACRGTPRVLDEMVLAARDIEAATGTVATTEVLLGFLEVEPDGLTRQHIHYLTAMRQYFRRYNQTEEWIEYVAGEAAMQQLLRETKQGIARIERFLVERGLIDKTPRGRRLTQLGISRAEQFIASGKGSSDVA